MSTSNSTYDNAALGTGALAHDGTSPATPVPTLTLEEKLAMRPEQ